MKKLFVLAITLMWGSLFLSAQQNQIPLETIKEIADRNAAALWGNVDPDDPIPYYSAQDEIIAYRFNYSIDKPFPQKSELVNQCQMFYKSNQDEEQWGIGRFGRILMTTNTSLPPILSYSNSVSSEYSQKYMLDSLANEYLGANSKLEKIYYLNDVHQWFQYKNGESSIYIKLKPPRKIVSQEEFDNIKTSVKRIAQEKDYNEKWMAYKAGKTPDSKATNMIPNPELCRRYDWSYGCTPTSAAMLFSWWDYRSIISGNDYAKLIRGYFKRDDCIQGETDYQIPEVQRTLAIEMETDTSCGGGGTWSYNCDNGIQNTADIQGYEMDADNKYTSKWWHVQDQIDDNHPLLVHSETHTYCALGYNDSDETIYTHTTWSAADEWISKDILACITRVTPETDGGQGITLTYPVGDTNYNATGDGEVFYPGEIYGITWDFETSIASTNIIYYSTNSDATAEEVIVSGTPNDGYYAWLVPAGIGSDECRIGINNNSSSSGSLLGMDGSMGMFTIYDPPVIDELGSYNTKTTDYNPDYFQFDMDEDAWCAVGIRNMTNSEWKLKLYDNLTYLNLIAESNMPPEISEVDFVVLDGNHLPDHTYGVKVDRLDGDDAGKIRYEGINSSLILGTNTINFSLYSVLKMYDVHLTPGYYTFTASSISGEASIALFNSSGGNNIQTLDDAMAVSNLGGWGESETFTICITTEDDYGFCIWTSSPSSQDWEVEIIEEHPGVWEGDYNSLWSNANNWSLNIVPSFGTNVIIPAGTPYNPYVTAYSFCGNITIEHGASLRVSSSNLVADGDMLIKGNLRIYENQSMTVNGDIIWTSTSSEYMENNTSINVGEDWTFDYGCSIQMSNGKVRFAGIEHSMIYCRSINSWFNDLEVDHSFSRVMPINTYISIPLQNSTTWLLSLQGISICKIPSLLIKMCISIGVF